MQKKSIKSIAFDLDDTLLDTSSLLVPQAARQSCQILIDAGLQTSLEVCLKRRSQWALLMSHTEIFPALAKEFGMTENHPAVQQAIDYFYNPPVPAFLPLIEGALENLEKLVSRYDLYVVTMGNTQTQHKKITALGILHFFKKIYVVNHKNKERKEHAFLDILQTHNLQPDELLSFGNRLSSEIRDAKKIGAWACHFVYGEHAEEKASSPFDQPDKSIYHHKDFIPTWEL